MTSIADQLSTAKGERGETANITLARKVAKTRDKAAVTELIRLVQEGKTAEQNDAIKVLYEIGALEPELIVSGVSVFAGFLASQNNRLQWGAMTALDKIAEVNPDTIAEHLDSIIAAAKQGTVITNDRAMAILVKLVGAKKHAAKALPYLFNRLKTSPANQFAMYAEMCLPAIDANDMKQFLAILTSRLKSLPKVSQQKRIEKLMRKITPTP